jgi:hypothetical protein
MYTCRTAVVLQCLLHWRLLIAYARALGCWNTVIAYTTANVAAIGQTYISAGVHLAKRCHTPARYRGQTVNQCVRHRGVLARLEGARSRVRVQLRSGIGARTGGLG